MNCASCGTLNQAGAKFCIQCGSGLARTCSVCGNANLPAARFCAECGSPMEPPTDRPAASIVPPAPAARPGVAERRLVTVVFADLVGFTTISEDRDPEDTRELLSRYFEVTRRIVEGHGGTVEKFIGDAVMAVWGAPIAHEDDAERAVRAALEIVAAVPALGDGELQLQARAGALTGEAAVTIGAEGQGMVAGDLVNTASRLQAAAEPGSVLAGEATVRAASGAIRFESAGEKSFKGKAEPMPTWRAVEVVAMRRGDRRAATLEPPFVGRDDELRQIKDLFETTSRERKPRLVSVIGQGGIGKSRLAWEFEKYLDGVVEDVYWHEGRSPAYGEGISYWALAEMVRRRARIADGDTPEIARERLTAMLETIIPDVAERRWVEPRLAGLLGVAELPQESREELFAAWRTFFERTAEQAPSVLVFVDLHWADQGLLDFIEYLLAWARSSPLFVVALGRPELLERRPDWGSQVRSVTRINLEPLGDAHMTRLLEGALPGLDPGAVRRIVERAEGIPLYAVETARMLLDTGAVVERDGRYEVVGDISHLAVAETLHALIAARLDATLPEDRSLLQDAAVLGQSFSVEALAGVSGVDGEALDQRLDRLTRRQLLVRDDDPRSPERGQYRFIQSLVREVAYQTLARPDRRARHLAAARFYETQEDEELAAVLATHYLEAHRASRPGPEADGLAAQARIALGAAAERASALHSNLQALALLEQALSVTREPAERAVLHLRAAEAGEYATVTRGISHAREAVALFRQLGQPEQVLESATWLGRHLVSSHLMDEAISGLQEAIHEAEPLGDIPQLAACLAELSRVYMLTDQHAEAVATADRALVVAGKHQLLGPTVEALINRGSSLSSVERRYEAEAVLRGAIVLADRHGLLSASLRARNNLVSSRYTDSTHETGQLYREGLDLANRFGHMPFRYQFIYQLADNAVRAGRWTDALAEIDAAEEADTPPPFGATSFTGVRAQLAAARGHAAEARAHQRRYVELSEQLHSPMVEAFGSLLAGYLALFEGDWQRCVQEGAPALANANTSSDSAAVSMNAAVAGNLPHALGPIRQALAATADAQELTDRWVLVAGEAGFAARAGRWAEAAAGYSRALEGIEASGNLLQWAVTSLEWGALGADRDAGAAEALRRGREFFAERGAAATADTYLAAFVPVEPLPGAAARTPAVGEAVPGH